MTGIHCKGICHRYHRGWNFSKGAYEGGLKRCQHCDIFIDYDEGKRCPCCNYGLREKPRSNIKRRTQAERVRLERRYIEAPQG